MGDVGRCATCKHWGVEPYEFDYLDHEAENYDGTSTTHTTSHRKCGAIRLAEFQDPVEAEVAAFTQDASGYKADLWTAPTFGCPLHEPQIAGEKGEASASNLVEKSDTGAGNQTSSEETAVTSGPSNEGEKKEPLAVTGWIPVTKRLPELSKRVIVTAHSGGYPEEQEVLTATCRRDGGGKYKWIVDDGDFDQGWWQVTHWMPLPEPAKP